MGPTKLKRGTEQLVLIITRLVSESGLENKKRGWENGDVVCLRVECGDLIGLFYAYIMPHMTLF